MVFAPCSASLQDGWPFAVAPHSPGERHEGKPFVGLCCSATEPVGNQQSSTLVARHDRALSLHWTWAAPTKKVLCPVNIHFSLTENHFSFSPRYDFHVIMAAASGSQPERRLAPTRQSGMGVKENKTNKVTLAYRSF